MSDKAPRFDNFVCIGNDPSLIAEISSFNRRNDHYFCVLDSPRMGRDDIDAEVKRRNNIFAYIQPKKIIFANLNIEEENALLEILPKNLIIKINNSDELHAKLPTPRSLRSEELHWGKERLGVGLLRAKKEKKRLIVDMQVSPEEIYQKGASSHLVVFEDGNDLSSVIAANYAFSINAGLAIIPKVPADKGESLIESFYTLYSSSGEPISDKLDSLRFQIKELVGDLNLRGVQCITFITAKLPWGFAFPEFPSTHFFLYPDFGLSVANGIIAEQPNFPGIRSSVLVEPGEYSGSETEIITEILSNRKSMVFLLTQEKAIVYHVDNMISLFPFDFLFIATHAAEVSGERLTYNFNDNEGNNRTLVVDRALGFGKVPGEDLINVQEMLNFISLDGIPWENKEKLNVKNSIIDFMALKKDDNLQPTKTEAIPRVRNSMALKMYDHNYLPILQTIADSNIPIVFNNACCSWKELAAHFIFAGSRVYIGTVFDVTGIEAKEIAKSFFNRHINRPLVFALWRAQNDVYADSKRRPYIMFGPHFSKVRMPKTNAKNYIMQKIPFIIKMWLKMAKNSNGENERKKHEDAAKFLTKVYKDLKNQNI